MKENVDIIIFGGQSNMQGQTESLSAAPAVEKAVEYRLLTDSFVPLKNPVGENITKDCTEGVQFENDTDYYWWIDTHVLASAAYGHTSLIPEFVRAYIKETGTPVVAVPAARGSTQICQWLPGTSGYDLIVKKVASAMKKAEGQYTIGKIYFVWLQGESDACFSVSKEDYKKQITELNNALKKDLKISKFAIIRVGKFTCDERDEEIISAQDEICEENSDFLMLTKIAKDLYDIPGYMNPQVSGHFGTKGVEKLGNEAGKALGKYRK